MALNENIVIRLMADTSNYTTKMQAASAQAETMAKAMEKPMTTGQRMEAGFTKAGLAVGALSAAIGVAAVKSFVDFDAKMSEVQANTGATGSALLALREAALNASRTSIYSAEDAADAINELGKAGMSTADILSGGLSAALTLAASDNMSTADATQYLSSAMVQFNLSGKDAGKVADALAAGAGKALGGVSDMGQALSMVGSTSHMLGASMQETVGTLAAMANAGNIGSEAGTQLRSALIGLMSPSKQVKGEMDELGLTLYDGQGKFVGIANFAGQLHDKLSKLPEAERNQAMGVLFSNAAMSAANTLYNEGADGINKWTSEVSDSGYAADLAAKKTDNLKGDLTKFLHTAQDVLIGIGGAANGPLRELTQGATNLLNLFRSMPESAQQWVVGSGMIVGSAAGLHKVLGGLSDSSSTFKQTMGLVLDPVQRVESALPQVASGASQLTGAFTGAGTGIQSMSGAASRGSQALGGLKSIGSGMLSMLGGPWGVAFTSAAIAVGILAQKQADAKARTQDMTSALQSGQTAAQKLKQNLDSGNNTDWGWFQKTRTGADSLASALDKAGVSQKTFVDAAMGDKAAIASFNQTLDDYVNKHGGAGTVTDELRAHLEQQTKAVSGSKEAMKEQAEADKQAAAEKVNNTLATAGLTDATSANTDATSEAADASDILAESFGASKKGINDTAAALGEALDALKTYYGFSLDASDATIVLHESFDKATKAVTDNGATLDLNTEKGRANQSALNDVAKSALDAAEANARNGQSVDQILPTIDDARNRFVDFAMKMGMSKDQANTLADQSGLTKDAVNRLTQSVNNVPTQHNTNLTATDNATPVIRNVRDMLAGLQDKTVTLNQVVNYMATGDLPSASGPLASGYKKVGKASGGYISGPGTATSDSIPARLSNGEYVIRAAAVDHYGVGLFDQLNYQRYAAGGLVQQYQTGVMPQQQVTKRDYANMPNQTVNYWQLRESDTSLMHKISRRMNSGLI
jgi:TP901 family phage tail tape measure protein